jgi:SAM-dependent methyltransferase
VGTWERAAERRVEFDAGAAEYDRNRPRYPDAVFEAITDGRPDARVVDVGAGTGIASVAFADRGHWVTAIEPAPAMAEIARSKLAGRGEVIVDTFENLSPVTGDIVTAFNSWHWVRPALGAAKVAATLRPGGLLALAWTEVVQFGDGDFDSRAGYAGTVLPLADAIATHLAALRDSPEFIDRGQQRFRLERTLDAETFIAVARTYPGPPDGARAETLRRIIDDEFGGKVCKIEDVVVYPWVRC